MPDLHFVFSQNIAGGERMAFAFGLLTIVEMWPDTGLEGIDQPRTVRDWLLLPIRVGR